MLDKDTIIKIEQLLQDGFSVVHVSDGDYATVAILKKLGISGKLSPTEAYYTFTLKE